MKTLNEWIIKIRRQQILILLSIVSIAMVMVYSIVITWCYFSLSSDFQKVMKEFRRDTENAEVYIIK